MSSHNLLIDSTLYQIGQMGGLCEGDTTSIKTEVNLMGSELVISAGIQDVINLQKDELRISGFPIDRSTIKKDSNSLILPVMKDINIELMVRFYLIYSFYINKYIKNTKEKSKYDEKFYELVKISHTSPEEQLKVAAFRKEYQLESNETKRGLIMLKYAFTANFIIDNINRIPLFSKDPKDIGHLIFPLTILHKTIKANYDKKGTRPNIPYYIIAPLDAIEEGYIKKILNKDAYFSFSVFMKGFTSEKLAVSRRKQLKNQPSKDKYFTFIISFPHQIDQMQSELNYGYSVTEDKNNDAVIKEGDVIFNIMNTFKVVKISQNGLQFELEYGYLPYLYHSKQARTLVGDTNLIRIFELCNAVSNHYLKSQSFLFRIIGGKEDSISTSNAIMSMKENSKATTDIERENLVNNHLDNNNFEAALIATQQGESLMMKAKRLQILYKQNKYSEAKTLIDELSGTIQTTKSSKDTKGSILDASEMMEYISALIDMKQSNYKSASEKLKKLRIAMLARYGNDFEFIGRHVIDREEDCHRKGVPKNTAENAYSPSNWEISNTGLNLAQIQ